MATRPVSFLDAMAQRPHLEFELPISHYHVGETFVVVVLPAEGGEFDIKISPKGGHFDSPLEILSNRIFIRSITKPGQYNVQARWRSDAQSDWSEWSVPLRFTIHGTDVDLQKYWEYDHRMSLMLEKGPSGAITLIDPDAEPPAKSGLPDARWFATPVYEGATPLYNETAEFYKEPLSYYLNCIDQLLEVGASFLTWHDILDGNRDKSRLQILLQFDVDGGPKSMRRLYTELVSRGIVATLMIHRRGHCWYPYAIEDVGIDWIMDAEKRGWAIGYHNNALSQMVGYQSPQYDERELEKARSIFSDDVLQLRKHFNIRTFTHHGGNVYNLKVTPSKELDIVGVDRLSSPHLWRDIKTMFSDGGFVSRPCPLADKVDSLSPGIHFFRNHPFKYGNYISPVDAPPRALRDFNKASLEPEQSTIDWRDSEMQKEVLWLKHRHSSRTKLRLNYPRIDKPVSSAFKSFPVVEERVRELRSKRKSSFLRLYPWAEGDPRVFWWRMLEAWAPRQGRLLNVGALPEDQKDEHNAFLYPDVCIEDMDIDGSRSPNYEMDICDAPLSLSSQFSGTLLFGLPYFASPSKAIESCARVTKPGGTGLFGFVADTHPARGSLWHPLSRHLWRKEKEPLTDIGLKANLWAFDEECLHELFRSWSSFNYEPMGHYWFVIARKDN